MAVPLMGIPVDTIIVMTLVLGSSMAAVAGILFAVSYPVLEPYMGALVGWKALISAVVGGIGEIRGAIAGGLILGFTEIFSRRRCARAPVVRAVPRSGMDGTISA